MTLWCLWIMDIKDRLQENGYRAHAVLTISEITETLYQAGVLMRSSSEL